jgi:hypothetical protein
MLADLTRDGYDTTIATDLLNTLLETQALHEQDHARILRELGE